MLLCSLDSAFCINWLGVESRAREDHSDGPYVVVAFLQQVLRVVKGRNRSNVSQIGVLQMVLSVEK